MLLSFIWYAPIAEAGELIRLSPENCMCSKGLSVLETRLFVQCVIQPHLNAKVLYYWSKKPHSKVRPSSKGPRRDNRWEKHFSVQKFFNNTFWKIFPFMYLASCTGALLYWNRKRPFANCCHKLKTRAQNNEKQCRTKSMHIIYVHNVHAHVMYCRWGRDNWQI